MNGVLNLLKPPGMTSHDAVALVRRVAGMKRVGHTGTLDPAAAGVLPICLGQATRLVEYLQAGTKEYIAEATFGYETDTLDALGQVVGKGATDGVSLESVRAALDGFRGAIEQMPPLYSAIRKEGKKLYELARAGVDIEDVEIAARPVQISRLFITRFQPATATAPPRAMLHIECSGGTYIRSLVRDIGRTLGSGATMTFLVRERNGAFPLHEARTLEQIADDITGAVVPILEVLRWCAAKVVVDDEATTHLMHGRQATATVSASAMDEICHYDDQPNRLRHFKQRRTKAMWQKSQRVLFLNQDSTLAALANSVSEDKANVYQAEKVFNLATSD